MCFYALKSKTETKHLFQLNFNPFSNRQDTSQLKYPRRRGVLHSRIFRTAQNPDDYKGFGVQVQQNLRLVL